MSIDDVGMSPKRLALLGRHDVWSRFFAKEAARIAASLASLSPRIEHIGSTAVPGLIAKPIIDIALIVEDEDAFDQSVVLLEGLGYRHRGQHGEDVLRRYFVLDDGDRRMAQLHLWAAAAPAWREAIAFRDLLRERADVREAYAREKRRVAEDAAWDKKAYSLAKGPFIADVLERWIR